MTTAVALLVATAAAAEPAAERKVFISCPILRNTALPCWLGQDAGQLYYLGPQTDLTSEFYPPQFHHRMLVEAEVAEGPPICGAIALKHVTASVLPDLDDSCNVMLPAEGYPDPPNNRGTGPSGVRGGARPPPPAERKPPAAAPLTTPYAARTFVATFNVDSDRKWGPAIESLTEAWRYAGAVNAQRVEITGYRAAIRLSNGQTYVEHPQVAEDRANASAQALVSLGLPRTTRVVVKWNSNAAPSAGLGRDAPARRAVIRIIPAAGS